MSMSVSDRSLREVVAILVTLAVVDALRPGVVAFKLESMRKTLAGAQLEGMVSGCRACGVQRQNVGELRVRAEQLRAADRLRHQHAVVHDPIKRVRPPVRSASNPSDRYCGSTWFRLKPPLPSARQLQPAIPDIGDVEQNRTRQFALDVEVPLHRPWRDGVLQHGVDVAPACVRRPAEVPGGGWKPCGYGLRSRLYGVIPSSVESPNWLSVRNPMLPGLP